MINIQHILIDDWFNTLEKYSELELAAGRAGPRAGPGRAEFWGKTSGPGRLFGIQLIIS